MRIVIIVSYPAIFRTYKAKLVVDLTYPPILPSALSLFEFRHFPTFIGSRTTSRSFQSSLKRQDSHGTNSLVTWYMSHSPLSPNSYSKCVIILKYAIRPRYSDIVGTGYSDVIEGCRYIAKFFFK